MYSPFIDAIFGYDVSLCFCPLSTKVENMLDFFERFNVYQSYEAEDTNRSIEDVFFR